MPFTHYCSRCGRTALSTSSDFIYWRAGPDSSVICTGCLTPSETTDDDTPLLTDSPDDQLLRDLDPDNDEADDDER
jgi:hypothetical protein